MGKETYDLAIDLEASKELFKSLGPAARRQRSTMQLSPRKTPST